MPKGYPLHPGDPVKSLEGIRALTAEERARIQTFPQAFRFLGNKTDKEQMIGNAVPVNLACFVGEAISEYAQTQGRNKKSPKRMMTYDRVWENQPVQLSMFEASATYEANPDKNAPAGRLPDPK